MAASRLRINPTLDRLRSVTPAAVLQEAIAPMFGLPSDVYVVLDEGPELEPLLVSNERLVAEIRAHATGSPAATGHRSAAVGGHAGAPRSRSSAARE